MHTYFWDSTLVQVTVWGDGVVESGEHGGGDSANSLLSAMPETQPQEFGLEVVSTQLLLRGHDTGSASRC